VTLIGAEERPPYDRPPLSKKVLTTDLDPTLKADFGALRVDPRLGEAATGLAGDVLLTSHGEYPFDRLVVATGALPVALPGTGRQRFLRTYDDAVELRALFRPGLRLAIIGPLVLAGPGGAAALWLAHGARRQPTDNPPPAGFYLAVTIATSLAAATLIATAMVYGHQWHPAAGVCILAGLTLTLLTGPHLKRAHPTTRRS